MNTDIATNRKAGRDFHISERYEAGIELRGTEVAQEKSIFLMPMRVSKKVSYSFTAAIFNHGKQRVYGFNMNPNVRDGCWFISARFSN